MKKNLKLAFVLLGAMFLSGLLFVPADKTLNAGYDCSYSKYKADIPEGTDDQMCVDKYNACQDENAAVAKVWGNCTGWGADEGVYGCHSIGREAWLVNPTLCPADYQNRSQFQEDYDWGEENLKYCQCVEACGPQPVAKDCWPTLENCCATLVEEEPEPEIEEAVLPPEPEKVETKTPTPLITETPESKPAVECPKNSSYQENKCVCDSGYMPNAAETCCAQELSAKARLTKIQNLYYENIPTGIASSGKLNNILSVFDSKYSKYACGGYQSMILELLDKLKFSEDCDTSALLNGYNYGPIEAFYKWHQAVVIYPEGTEWLQTGLVLDPWPNQKPEIYTIEDWGIMFSGGSYWGVRGSSAYTDGYPTVGGEYKNPNLFDISSSAVKSYLQSLPTEKQTQFKNLTAYEKRAYMYWQGQKSAVRVHVHSPVEIMIKDKNNKRIGRSVSGEYYNETDNIYMRTQQMADGHYSYDIYMTAGIYDLTLTGNDDGKAQIVIAIEKNGKYLVKQAGVDINEGKKINLNINSDKNSATSDGLNFVNVARAEDIKNIPLAKQVAISGDLDDWYEKNWDKYFDEVKSKNNIWIWILYGAGAFIFIAALILAIILLVMKKKFLIVLLIFMLIMLFSCTSSGIATYLLYTAWNGDVDRSVKDQKTIEAENEQINNTVENEITSDEEGADTDTESKNDAETISPLDYAAQGLILNTDYNFTLDVGKNYAGKYRVQKNINEGFVTDSYAYCYDTKEKYEDDVYCRSGEINLFTVDVMTQQQWSDMFSDDYSVTPFDMGYQVMTDRGGMIYAYSHLNGILPFDAPAEENYYENIPQSIKFVSN